MGRWLWGMLAVACQVTEPRSPIEPGRSRAALTETLVWTAGPAGPPEREGTGLLAFDSAHGRVVLFGGEQADGIGGCFGNSVALGDTWELSDAGWQSLATAGGPSARWGHALAYAGGGKTLLFGGSTGGNETWEWDGAAWQLRADAGPPGHCRGAMVFDAARGRVVYFGGDPNCSFSAGSQETWEWDGGSWGLIADAGPAARSGHAMVFDSRRNRVVLTGGFSSAAGGLGDTWEWDGVFWRQVAADDAGPPAGLMRPMVYDPYLGLALLYLNGRSCNRLQCSCTCSYSSEVWAWNGSDWSQLGTGGVPGRADSAMVFDPASRRTVLVGGSTDDCCCGYPKGDTWFLQAHGGSCSSAADCDTAACVDGVCCLQASCGTCQACQPVSGLCTPLRSQPDPDSCAGQSTCDVSGACVSVGNLPLGAQCSNAPMCSSGACERGACCAPGPTGACGAQSDGGLPPAALQVGPGCGATPAAPLGLALLALLAARGRLRRGSPRR